MSSGVIAALGAVVFVLLFCSFVNAAGALALLWAYSKLRPQEAFQSSMASLSAMVDELESQVIKLRTKKAGARSAAKAAAASDQQDNSVPEGEDPLLEGLNADERALFQ